MPKFKLNVFERITTMQVLPKEGNFITLKVIRDTNSVLGLSEKEFKEFNIKQEGDKVTWNANGNKEKEIELGEKASDLIADSLKKLSENKKLEQRHFSLFEKFVEEK